LPRPAILTAGIGSGSKVLRGADSPRVSMEYSTGRFRRPDHVSHPHDLGGGSRALPGIAEGSTMKLT
jgi:hypothetical protein